MQLWIYVNLKLHKALAIFQPPNHDIFSKLVKQTYLFLHKKHFLTQSVIQATGDGAVRMNCETKHFPDTVVCLFNSNKILQQQEKVILSFVLKRLSPAPILLFSYKFVVDNGSNFLFVFVNAL